MMAILEGKESEIEQQVDDVVSLLRRCGDDVGANVALRGEGGEGRLLVPVSQVSGQQANDYYLQLNPRDATHLK